MEKQPAVAATAANVGAVAIEVYSITEKAMRHA